MLLNFLTNIVQSTLQNFRPDAVKAMQWQYPTSKYEITIRWQYQTPNRFQNPRQPRISILEFNTISHLKNRWNSQHSRLGKQIVQIPSQLQVGMHSQLKDKLKTYRCVDFTTVENLTAVSIFTPISGLVLPCHSIIEFHGTFNLHGDLKFQTRLKRSLSLPCLSHLQRNFKF